MNPIATQETTTAPATAAAPSAQAEPIQREAIRPAVNIFETESAFVLEAEMPGVNKGGVSLNLQGAFLALEGRRQTTVSADAEELYRESSPADFRRVFRIDPSIDTSAITARVEQGVLTVTLPKSESSKPRQIAVV